MKLPFVFQPDPQESYKIRFCGFVWSKTQIQICLMLLKPLGLDLDEERWVNLELINREVKHEIVKVCLRVGTEEDVKSAFGLVGYQICACGDG